VSAAADLEELGKSSRRAAIVSAAGLTILAGSLVAAGARLGSAEKRVSAAREEVNAMRLERDGLQKEQAALAADISRLKGQKTDLERKNLGLEAEVEKLRGPLQKLVEIDAAAQKLGLSDPKGRPLYDFSIWLKLPEFRKSEIKKVRYHFDNPSAILKDRYADNPANGFSISYRGWGCFPDIRVTLTTADGGAIEMPLDQCAKLAWTKGATPTAP